MNDRLTTLTPEIRQALVPERSRGHVAPATGAGRQQPAASAPQSAVADTGIAKTPVQRKFPGRAGPAFRDAPNNFGWLRQTSMEIMSYAETVAVRDLGIDEPLVINPAEAPVWRVTAPGSFAVSITELPATDIDGQPSPRTYGVVLMVYRAAGSAISFPPAIMWGADVRDPEADMLGPAEAARLDVFVLERVPGIGLLGFVAAQDMRQL